MKSSCCQSDLTITYTEKRKGEYVEFIPVAFCKKCGKEITAKEIKEKSKGKL